VGIRVEPIQELASFKHIILI